MWIFSKFGFYSIVQKDSGYQARTREKKDLSNIINACGFFDKEIKESVLTDYQYRICVSKEEVFIIMEIL
ncbi:MAG: hypothetical protein M0P12_00860 [Paludibacteraceae bacterium]|nr:hypothetical protein [Paludibacteraceae bacterium]